MSVIVHMSAGACIHHVDWLGSVVKEVHVRSNDKLGFSEEGIWTECGSDLWLADVHLLA